MTSCMLLLEHIFFSNFMSIKLVLVQGCKFKEAEEIFETLLNEETSHLKPDQKMFHMMIYMYKKAGSYEKARKIFAQMAERGVQQSTVTYNSLMSFETNYKEVSRIYDQVKISEIIEFSFHVANLHILLCYLSRILRL